MAQITAAAVTALRKKTGLPMMECKKALTECDGDENQAIEWLRSRGAKVAADRADRETAFGRFGLYCDPSASTGAIVELKCESAPVAANEEFVALANDLAKQLATGPGAADGEELLDQVSPGKDGITLREQRDELFNRIREVFNVGRFHRFETGCGGYSHNSGTVSGVLLSIEGGDEETAKNVSMHVAAMRPKALSKEDLDSEIVERERSVLRAAALEEGKPENIVDKMVEGRLKNFFAESVLLEQPYVKDDKMSVGQYAESAGMKILAFKHWELGVE